MSADELKKRFESWDKYRIPINSYLKREWSRCAAIHRLGNFLETDFKVKNTKNTQKGNT